MRRYTICEQLKLIAPIVVYILVGMVVININPTPALSQVCPSTKVPICHKPGTPDEEDKCVPRRAKQAHLAHGDTRGTCDPFAACDHSPFVEGDPLEASCHQLVAAVCDVDNFC